MYMSPSCPLFFLEQSPTFAENEIENELFNLNLMT